MSDHRQRKVAQQMSRGDEMRKRHAAKLNSSPSCSTDRDEAYFKIPFSKKNVERTENRFGQTQSTGQRKNPAFRSQTMLAPRNSLQMLAVFAYRCFGAAERLQSEI